MVVRFATIAVGTRAVSSVAAISRATSPTPRTAVTYPTRFTPRGRGPDGRACHRRFMSVEHVFFGRDDPRRDVWSSGVRIQPRYSSAPSPASDGNTSWIDSSSCQTRVR